uniref:Peptidase M12B domain-containing protein n=1 Tax=Strongyloides papillosus TaxID=174720 RepID=A0A0N5B844_STREA
MKNKYYKFPSILWGIKLFLYLSYLINISNGFHHKLTKRELLNTFGVENHDDTPEYLFIKAEKSIDQIGNKIIKFNAWNDTFLIKLKSNYNIIGKDITTVIRDGNNTTKVKFNFDDCHYQGEVISHGVNAAISDCSENLLGTIAMKDHFLIVQTIPRRIKNIEDKRHIIFKRSAALIPEQVILDIEEKKIKMINDSPNINKVEEFCDVDSKNLVINYTLPPEAKIDSLFIFPQMDPMTLEIALFLDSELYNYFKREFSLEPEKHLMDFSLALINNVHLLYQQPTLSPNLEIVIVHFEMWKSQPNGLETFIHRNGQAQTLLDAFCRYQSRINPGTDLTDSGHWDHGVMLTGYDIYHTTKSVAGVAPVGRMCDDVFSCSLVEGLHLGRSFVLAHEMGHSFGMVHDGVQNDCHKSSYLMSSVNGAGKTTWSECSSREFTAFLRQLDDSGRGNCLRDPSISISKADHLKDGRLPGQRFTLDQQCSYFWGTDYQVEIPNGRRLEDICRILWCGNNGSTISTAHPALEGSWCGDKKWCHHGKCTKWKFDSDEPSIINGEWSSWFSKESSCPITPCQIKDSINVRSQIRTCNNPAPNNGGSACKGNSIRGIICGSSKCTGLTQQQYGDKLCSALKNDKTKPDRQLSGKSFLHHQQPCKVWCHLKDSELIRNKGQFPNGSPCGDGKYCVGGSCLRVSCNNTMLTNNEEDCESNLLDKIDASKIWSQWSSWSNCSVDCGTSGVQKRTRECVVSFKVNINKKKTQKPKVDIKKQAISFFDFFKPKSANNKNNKNNAKKVGPKKGKKGINNKAKKGGKLKNQIMGNEDLNCFGNSLEIRPCNPKPPPCIILGTWEEWSPCNNGEQIRKRKCLSGDNCNKEEMVVRRECSLVKEWSSWLPCSVSCGIGFQLRERLCNGVACKDSQKQAKTCNIQDCMSTKKEEYQLSEWSEFSECSMTCGEGLKTRVRNCMKGKCPISLKYTETVTCNVESCENKWGEWKEWGECDSICGEGKQKRTRSCQADFVFLCSGESFEERVCFGEPCIMRSSSTLKNLDLPTWSEWSSYSECSCYTQTQYKRRYCQILDPSLQGFCVGPITETRSCQPVNCRPINGGWGEWSEFSECSKKCGTSIGHQIRNRMCSNPLPANKGAYCSGYSFDQRPCRGDIEKCVDFPIDGEWSEWSEFGECIDCKYTSRTRYCNNPAPKNNGKSCKGKDYEMKTCSCNDDPNMYVEGSGSDNSWSEWSEWNNSSNCLRERFRICSGSCKEEAYQKIDECHDEKDKYNEWSEWSNCQITNCSSLSSTRTRSRNCVTSCGEYYKFEEELCNQKFQVKGMNKFYKLKSCSSFVKNLLASF